ncbi:hypothetical protein [Fictibacillus arsenicus]|uniref:Uncharacterized protein n=1 Tax=Fictibacillus arsenicus TaxID=255247 RepID=A0A1V3GCE3_9BACL|nr:hypothetical protein [Fictibacillus arsenicus]OOE14520.1 hypothetical protein UN64_04830 [Fictibacillus arsenicus]
MRKFYIISLLLWSVFYTITLYRFFQGTGYWNNTIMLSAVFYILAIILNKGFNKLLITIALSYVSFVLIFILDLLTGFPFEGQ